MLFSSPFNQVQNLFVSYLGLRRNALSHSFKTKGIALHSISEQWSYICGSPATLSYITKTTTLVLLWSRALCDRYNSQYLQAHPNISRPCKQHKIPKACTACNLKRTEALKMSLSKWTKLREVSKTYALPSLNRKVTFK